MFFNLMTNVYIDDIIYSKGEMLGNNNVKVTSESLLEFLKN